MIPHRHNSCLHYQQLAQCVTSKHCLFGLVRLFTYGHGHSVREVAGSRLGRGTIVRGAFHPAKQLARFSPPNMSHILNLFRISLCGEAAIKYRLHASPPFEVASHIKNCHFGHIILYYYYMWQKCQKIFTIFRVLHLISH